MGTPNSAYITLVVMSGVFNLLLVLYAYSKKSAFSGAKTFMAVALLSAVYTFAFAFELSSDSLEQIKRCVNIEYVGMPFIPPLSLMLVLHYIGMERYLSKRNVLLLLVVPAVTLLLVTTNDAHHLFYRSIYLRAGTSSPRADILFGYGYIIHAAYTFGCLLTGIILLLRHWNRMKAVYRLQLRTMLIGLLLPMTAAFLYLMGLTPDGMDPVPIVMSLTSALSIWSLTSAHMLTVAPIARENLFESMRDGVLVLDLDGRLIDYNRAAVPLIPELGRSAIGKPIGPIWSLHTDTLHTSSPGDLLQSREHEVRWTVGARLYTIQIRTSVVHKDNGQEAGMLIVLIDVTERQELQDKLQRLAYYDGLTGICNRTHFIQLARTLLTETRAAGKPLSIVLFDIDHFKQINDSFGHEAGDRALLHAVSCCQKLLRPEDVFGRYGGEEFVLCLPELSASEAVETAQRLRRTLEAASLQLEEGEIQVTASFGVVEASSPQSSLTLLLRQADDALYESKHAGRNSVHLMQGGEIRRAEENPAVAV